MTIKITLVLPGGSHADHELRIGDVIAASLIGDPDPVLKVTHEAEGHVIVQLRSDSERLTADDVKILSEAES